MIIRRFGRTTRPANVKFIGRNPKPERASQVEALLRQGMKPSEIADTLGMNRAVLSRFMARWGIRKP